HSRVGPRTGIRNHGFHAECMYPRRHVRPRSKEQRVVVVHAGSDLRVVLDGLVHGRLRIKTQPQAHLWTPDGPQESRAPEQLQHRAGLIDRNLHRHLVDGNPNVASNRRLREKLLQIEHIPLADGVPHNEARAPFLWRNCWHGPTLLVRRLAPVAASVVSEDPRVERLSGDLTWEIKRVLPAPGFRRRTIRRVVCGVRPPMNLKPVPVWRWRRFHLNPKAAWSCSVAADDR